MKADEIHIDDWARILVGNVPWTFYIESIIRLLFIYTLLMVAIRVMGKRMSARLGRNELAAVVVLAAAIGAPIQAPERGLVPALLIAVIVVLVERAISSVAFRNQKFEQYTQGNLSILVRDGVLDLKAMEKARISRDRLFAELRSNEIKHLGVVERLYLEACGDFTMIKTNQPQAGLSVLPEWDTEFNAEQPRDSNVQVCNHCAKVKAGAESDCSNCHNSSWATPIK